jgi:hypothetical protein
MLGLVHPEFASIAQRTERFWTADFPGLQEADYGRKDGEIEYAWPRGTPTVRPIHCFFTRSA